MDVYLMEQVVGHRNYFQWEAFEFSDSINTSKLLFELKVYKLQVMAEYTRWFLKPSLHVLLINHGRESWDYEFIKSLLKNEMENFDEMEFLEENFMCFQKGVSA